MEDSQFPVEICQDIIATLTIEAPNHSIRNCLRSYDTSKPTKDIRKTLYQFKKDQLSETLEFLSKKKISEKLKKNLKY